MIENKTSHVIAQLMEPDVYMTSADHNRNPRVFGRPPEMPKDESDKLTRGWYAKGPFGCLQNKIFIDLNIARIK